MAARAVERHRHRRRTGLRVGLVSLVDQLFAGGDHALAEQDRDRLAVRAELLAVVDARVRWHGAAGDRVVGIALHRGAVFQRGGRADDALGLRGVLHARQFDDYPVRALALDDRLGHADPVDPVAQRTDVLLDRTARSEEHTPELPSLMRISYAVFWFKKQRYTQVQQQTTPHANSTTQTSNI